MTDFFEYAELFAVLIGASLWCFGVHTVANKAILEVFKVNVDKQWYKFSKWQRTLLKPLFACPPCMASVHGTIIFFIMLFGSYGILYWPVFCICLCGLNYIITSLLPEYE